ncbi:hypothetical protein [Rossellomorea sp. SC111]|uniref:hypothetical protein n=1 Tax=Rossellomorea sp. SC111 TaxID=2968985 RepID=UPI00215AAD5F|nr:hypothetical protein [Rossellomorea sp. SC111]
MRYYIDLGWVFLSCIVIMILSKVWTILGDYPEVFKYGSIIYQVVDVFYLLLLIFCIGIAAAIVYYYIQQLVDKKRIYIAYYIFDIPILLDTYRSRAPLIDTTTIYFAECF